MVALNSLVPNTSSKLDISGLSLDSRTVKPGYLFAALPGEKVDGRHFVPQAIKSGAQAVLVPEGSGIETEDALIIEHRNPRQIFAKACATFYARQPQTCAAVTGTNGKSSCVSFIRELWSLLNHKAASVGTLGISAPDLEITGKLTTPDPVCLHKNLALLQEHGVSHMAMEASSHGLDQYRLDGVKVQIAAFTNLSRDHLDYHGTMEAYLRAKSRLFTDILDPHGHAVLNADIAEFSTLHELCTQRGVQLLTYGQKGTDLRLISVDIKEGVQKLSLNVLGKAYEVELHLAGRFQIENALCALGVVLASGACAEEAVPLLAHLSGVPGRMEHMGQNVYVDYAHTPDALETVLKALRPHCEKELIVLFGCGGDRDAGKRAQMGAVGQKWADKVIVTDDNPRSEDPALIRKEILSACPNALEIADRKQAITSALLNMKAGDLVVLAGKGHESGQIIKDQTLPFDDRALAKDILEERGHR